MRDSVPLKRRCAADVFVLMPRAGCNLAARISDACQWFAAACVLLSFFVKALAVRRAGQKMIPFHCAGDACAPAAAFIRSCSFLWAFPRRVDDASGSGCPHSPSARIPLRAQTIAPILNAVRLQTKMVSTFPQRWVLLFSTSAGRSNRRRTGRG
jgi:hypothetical protein